MPPSQGSEGGGLCRSAHFLFLIQPGPQPIPPPRLVSIPGWDSWLPFILRGLVGWRQTEKTDLTFLLTSGILCASCVLSVPFIRL